MVTQDPPDSLVDSMMSDNGMLQGEIATYRARIRKLEGELDNLKKSSLDNENGEVHKPVRR